MTRTFGVGVYAWNQMSHPGQAYFAGSGPLGRTCRECAHFLSRDHFSANKSSAPNGLKPGPCGKYTEMAGGRGPDIPHHAAACKYFAANPAPPAAKRTG